MRTRTIKGMSSRVIPISQPASNRRHRALPFYAALVLGFMVLVILEGALVRATGSGAGCGDHWPLCNGVFFPHHPRLATLIEYTHRSMTGICTLLVALLIGWTFLARPRGDRSRRAVVWCGILLVTEALLGAVLVKGGYVEGNTSDMRVVVQCIHFTNTMLLLASITLTWWWLRKRPRPQPVGKQPLGAPPFGAGAPAAAWLALIATLFVGAAGSVAALADTLFPPSSVQAAFLQDFAAHSPLLLRMRWLHPASAMIALACALWLAIQIRSRLGGIVLLLIGAQILLGVADVLLLAPTWIQILHLLGADLYWIALVTACATVLAPQRPALTTVR